MKRLLVTLMAMGASSSVFAAPMPVTAPQTEAVKMADSRVTRKIDCAGRDLTVTGDENTLTVKGCVTINVVGNHNQMLAQLLPDSTIAALGNGNHIVFLHAPGFEVQVSSSGSGNEIIPQMARDMGDGSPVKIPLGH